MPQDSPAERAYQSGSVGLPAGPGVDHDLAGGGQQRETAAGTFGAHP
jgi:hypothetical protein